MPQKAATTAHEIKTPQTNGVYHLKSSPVRLLLFDPADETNAEYRDLKVYVRTKIPMGVYFQTAKPVDAADLDYWEKVTARHYDFAKRALVSWNLVYPDDDERGGEPIPCTPEGFLELDVDLGAAIRNAWFYTLRTPEEASDPLASGQPSNDGAP